MCVQVSVHNAAGTVITSVADLPARFELQLRVEGEPVLEMMTQAMYPTSDSLAGAIYLSSNPTVLADVQALGATLPAAAGALRPGGAVSAGSAPSAASAVSAAGSAPAEARPMFAVRRPCVRAARA